MRLLLVEDNPTLARAVKAAIEKKRPGFAIEHVASARAAIAAVDAGIFDLAIVDIGLPDASGAVVLRELAQRTPPVRAVAFTIFDDRENVLAAIRAGAVGYLLKEEPIDRVLAQLDECLEGHMPVSSRVARYLFELGRDRATSGGESAPLTTREEDILACLQRGCTYAECASALGVRLGTVQTHVKNLYRKLDVTTKAEAAAWATRHRSS